MSTEEPLITSEYLFGNGLADSCRIRWNLAKLDTLWVTVHNDAPVQETNVPANKSVIIECLKNILYGKVHTDPTDPCGPQINEKDH